MCKWKLIEDHDSFLSHKWDCVISINNHSCKIIIDIIFIIFLIDLYLVLLVEIQMRHHSKGFPILSSVNHHFPREILWISLLLFFFCYERKILLLSLYLINKWIFLKIYEEIYKHNVLFDIIKGGFSYAYFIYPHRGKLYSCCKI